jgi:hypothetical protein
MSKFAIPFCIAIAMVLSSAAPVAVFGAEAPTDEKTTREVAVPANPAAVKRQRTRSGKERKSDDAGKPDASKKQEPRQNTESDAVKAWREHDI